MKKIPVLALFLFTTTFLFAQSPPDTSHLRISLVTCSAGADLYSIFGHTGIRVTDSSRNADVVFNYGTFDDSDPYFYLKFTRGIMRYSLSVWPYPNFMEEYKDEHRGVTEQVLNLNEEEKLRLLNAMMLNATENNRYYDYRFHTDNCTTRARDMVSKSTDTPVHFNNILPQQPPSFRQLIHNSLDKGGQYWNKLAIDLLLGAHLDTTVTNEQAMFLPDYLAKGFDRAAVDRHPLVTETVELLHAAPLPKADGWFTPTVFFSVLLLIGIALSFGRGRVFTRTLRIFDTVLFCAVGLMGIVMCTLWIARVDNVCRNNWNLLWALPTHTVMAFMLSKQKQWMRVYRLLALALLVLLLMGWKWLPQELNGALLPLIVLLALRILGRMKATAAAQ